MARFSLKWFLLFVAAVCASVAAVVKPNEWWTYAASFLLIAALCYGCIYIAIGGPRRGFWIGFVLAIAVNALLMHFSIAGGHPIYSIANSISDVAHTVGPPPQPPIPNAFSDYASYDKAAKQHEQVHQQHQLSVHQANRRRGEFQGCLVTLMLLWFGALGGWVGQLLASRKDAR